MSNQDTEVTVKYVKHLEAVNAELITALEEISKKSNTTGYGRGALGVIARAALAKARGES